MPACGGTLLQSWHWHLPRGRHLLPWQLPVVPAGTDAHPGAVRSYWHTACHRLQLSPVVATSVSPPGWPLAAGWACPWHESHQAAGAAGMCRVWPRLHAVSLLPLGGCLCTCALHRTAALHAAHCPLARCPLQLGAARSRLPAAASAQPPAHACLHIAHCRLHTAFCCRHLAHCTLHAAACTLRTAHRCRHSARCTLTPACCQALCVLPTAARGVLSPGQVTRQPTSPGILPALCQSSLGTRVRMPLSRALC